MAVTAQAHELDGFANLIADRIAERLAEHVAEEVVARLIEHVDAPDRWLDSAEAAEHLGPTVYALDKLCAARTVPFEQDSRAASAGSEPRSRRTETRGPHQEAKLVDTRAYSRATAQARTSGLPLESLFRLTRWGPIKPVDDGDRTSGAPPSRR